MGVHVPELNTFCCGCTLKTGSLIALWFCLLSGIVSMLVPNFTVDEHKFPVADITVQNGTTFYREKKYIFYDNLDLGFLQRIGVWAILFGVFSVISSGSGLIGVYKTKPKMLLPFLTWELFFAILLFIGNLVVMFTFGNIIAQIIELALFLYFWMIVYNYYLVLTGSARPLPA